MKHNLVTTVQTFSETLLLLCWWWWWLQNNAELVLFTVGIIQFLIKKIIISPCNFVMINSALLILFCGIIFATANLG